MSLPFAKTLVRFWERQLFRTRRFWLWMGAGSIVLVSLSVGAIALHAIGQIPTILRPAKNPTCCTLLTTGLAAKSLSLMTEDRVKLACWYVPSRNRAAIVAFHGEGSNRMGLLAHMRLFARHGYGVLACDRRAHGASEGMQRSWGWRETNDIAPMLAYLYRQTDVDARRIGVFGFSMGAQIALRAAAMHASVRAVVADGAVPATSADLFPPNNLWEYPRASGDWLDNWFVDRLLENQLSMQAPRSVIASIQQRPSQPLLFISTGQTGRGRELRQVFHFYDRAPQPKQLWELPDVGHGEGLAKHPDAYAQRAIDFFDSTLK